MAAIAIRRSAARRVGPSVVSPATGLAGSLTSADQRNQPRRTSTTTTDVSGGMAAGAITLPSLG